MPIAIVPAGVRLGIGRASGTLGTSSPVGVPGPAQNRLTRVAPGSERSHLAQDTALDAGSGAVYGAVRANEAGGPRTVLPWGTERSQPASLLPPRYDLDVDTGGASPRRGCGGSGFGEQARHWADLRSDQRLLETVSASRAADAEKQQASADVLRARESVRAQRAQVLRDTPHPIQVGGHVLIWPAKGTVSRSKNFMRPDGENLVGFGLLPAVPQKFWSEVKERFENASRMMLMYGAKRYLSGWVDFTADE